ncbi:uncharacterized protein LOC124120356 [Haliotis rufescens]|uniref:uncharacterized protein LOC124120356 n=1 Tax=Haliotis rufescens TaxID=6454 RepID=UPI00201F2A27|nr:uncharacterized protein LOC124120356 [Haliotis rufescens]
MMRCIQSLVFILHLLCVDGGIKPGDAWGSCEDAHTIARAGDNVTLSCNVFRSYTGALQCKLHKQRTKRTCNKTKVRSCAFYNVTHRESGLYRCNVGLGDLKPFRELGCWQTLVVIEDVQDPYILVTAGDGDSVSLTCCFISVSEPADYNLSVDFTWKRNTTQLVSTTHGVSTWRWIRYHSSTITVSGVTGDDEGDRYTCHVGVKGLPSTVWSQEYMLQAAAVK